MQPKFFWIYNIFVKIRLSVVMGFCWVWKLKPAEFPTSVKWYWDQANFPVPVLNKTSVISSVILMVNIFIILEK